jgi:hypothetical protein
MIFVYAFWQHMHFSTLGLRKILINRTNVILYGPVEDLVDTPNTTQVFLVVLEDLVNTG